MPLIDMRVMLLVLKVQTMQKGSSSEELTTKDSSKYDKYWIVL